MTIGERIGYGVAVLADKLVHERRLTKLGKALLVVFVLSFIFGLWVVSGGLYELIMSFRG